MAECIYSVENGEMANPLCSSPSPPLLVERVNKYRRKESSKSKKSKSECRICLKHDGKVPIFGEGRKPDISADICLFGNIHLSKDDYFPKYICNDCYNQLEGAISFRKAAKHSDALLKRRRRRKSTHNDPNPVKIEIDVEMDYDSKKELAEEVVTKEEDDVFHDENDFDINDLPFEERVRSLTSDDDDDNDILSDIKKRVKIESDKQKTKYYCKMCNIKFETPKEHKEHRLSEEHKKNYQEKQNRKKLKISKEKMRNYQKDQKCDVCGKMFTKNQFLKHVRKEHKIKVTMPVRTKECPICRKLFRGYYLGRHIRTVHGERKLKARMECPICKKLLAHDYFQLHVKTHDEGANTAYICDQCGKKFTFQSSLANHRLTHTTDLPFKCEYCPYRGRSRNLLNIHVRTHTGNYPYKCDQCNCSFITKSNLNRHMQRHRGPVDFVCDSCHRGFYNKLELERHITVIHLGIKDHICNMCGAAFGYRHGLVKHQRKVHKTAKTKGRAKATYLKYEEEGILQRDSL